MNVRQVVPRDAIPSIDEPAFVETYFGDPGEEVIVVDPEKLVDDPEKLVDDPETSSASPPDVGSAAAGTNATNQNVRAEPARAYPFRILNFHEIANDVVVGVPVAVTWCPLCGSAIVYDRRVGGRTLEFGVSGKLADDDLVMYDRETGSEWKQSLGEAIAGPLDGRRLTVLPAPVTTWEQFRETHPDGVVLARPGGESEASGEGSDPERVEYTAEPYREYFARDGIGLAAHHGEAGREWPRDDLHPKAIVLGIEPGSDSDGDGGHGSDALGFPLPWVEDAGGVVTATVGETDVVVFATDDGIHAFENPDYEFEPSEDGRFLADGTTWDGATGVAADGRSLDRVPAKRLFAFAWQDDHGPDAFFDSD